MGNGERYKKEKVIYLEKEVMHLHGFPYGEKKANGKYAKTGHVRRERGILRR